VLLSNNPNAGNPANGLNAINPFRLSHSQAATCDQDHAYGDEQAAFDLGLMDRFPSSVGSGSCGGFDYGHSKGLVMGYFDGNTVTAMWNYAQNFAMSDNSFGTTFGPSTPGLLNLVAGQTGGVTSEINPGSQVVGTTVVGDPDPLHDVCSSPTRTQVQMAGPNIGNLLNAKGVSWGSFMGGFDLTVMNANGTTGCLRSSPAAPSNGGPTADYIPHHAFFQYFGLTSNPMHTRPTVPPSQYGTNADTGANHNYDIHDFFDAMSAGNLPAVSFIKAPAFADGHAGYSDPLLEQAFVVNTINTIMTSKFWKRTAIIIAYDDSDGWYDHQMNPIVNSSYTVQDKLSGANKCGNGTPLKDATNTPIQGRCGYGPRLPLIVVSPFAKANFVDHSLTDQSSIIRFVEDNWGTGRIGGGSFDALAGPLTNMFDFSEEHESDERVLILDPTTGRGHGGD
jgi:phospholipase C